MASRHLRRGANLGWGEAEGAEVAVEPLVCVSGWALGSRGCLGGNS